MENSERYSMIPVTLITPENIWEISISEKSIPTVRALAKTWGDTSEYCEIALVNEYHTHVPIAAIKQLDRMYQAGAFA
jgi:hypothetical protein